MTKDEHLRKAAYHAHKKQQLNAVLERIQILLPDITCPGDIPIKDLMALLHTRYPDGVPGGFFVNGPQAFQ